MRKTILLTLLLFNCVSFQLMAQNGKGAANDSTFRAQLLQENYNYRHKKDSVGDSIKAKGDQIKAAQQELQRIEALIAQEKSAAQSQKPKEELDSLKKLKTTLGFSLDSLAKASNVVSPNQHGDDNAVSQMRKSLNDSAAEIERLKQQLAGMGDFKAMWVKQEAASVGDMAGRPLSQLNLTEIELTQTQFEEVAAKDKSVAAALAKLKKIVDEKTAYDAAMKVISEPYDAANVAKSTDAVQKMLASATGDKKNELSDLSWRLRYYADCLDIFKEVVDRVEKEGGESDYRKAQEVFNAEEADGEGITTIRKVPWIDATFNNYANALKQGKADVVKSIKKSLGK